MLACPIESECMPGTHEMLQAAATLKRTNLHESVDTVTLSLYVQLRAFETALVSGGQVFLSALRCNACVLRITATLAAAAAPPPLPCAESLAGYLLKPDCPSQPAGNFLRTI